MQIVGKGWWKCAYSNEFLLLVPGITWSTIRKKWPQRVCDVLRVIPFYLIVAYVVRLEMFPPSNVLFYMGIVAVVLNIAMYAIDKAHAPHPYTWQAEIVVLLCMASPTALLFGSPGLWLNTGKRKLQNLRYVAIASNLTLAAYLFVSISILLPYLDAWTCYPHPRDVQSFTQGYCPQWHIIHTPDWDPKQLIGTPCYYFWQDGKFGESTKRCQAGHQSSSVHQEMSAIQHVAIQIAVVSLASYAAQVPAAMMAVRTAACAKLS